MTSVQHGASAPDERFDAPAARLTAANLHKHVRDLQTKVWMTAVDKLQGSFPPLAETSEQKAALNTLAQRGLPGLPYGSWKLDSDLLAPRLRVGATPGGSPFRGPLDPAVLYAAPTKKTALMDMAYHRWRFLTETSDALSSISRVAVFEVQLRTLCLDLRRAEFQQAPHPMYHRSDSPNTQRDHNDFRNTQRIGRLARAANIGAVAYAWPSDRVGAGEAHRAGGTHGAGEAHVAGVTHGAGEAHFAGVTHGAGDDWRVVIFDLDAFWLADFIFVREEWSMRVTRRNVEFHSLNDETSFSTDQWRHVMLDGPVAARQAQRTSGGTSCSTDQWQHVRLNGPVAALHG